MAKCREQERRRNAKERVIPDVNEKHNKTKNVGAGEQEETPMWIEVSTCQGDLDQDFIKDNQKWTPGCS